MKVQCPKYNPPQTEGAEAGSKIKIHKEIRILENAVADEESDIEGKLQKAVTECHNDVDAKVREITSDGDDVFVKTKRRKMESKAIKGKTQKQETTLITIAPDSQAKGKKITHTIQNQALRNNEPLNKHIHTEMQNILPTFQCIIKIQTLKTYNKMEEHRKGQNAKLTISK